MRRKSREEIAKVCESWWAKLASSTRGEQYQYAEQLLEALDWEAPERICTQANWQKAASASYALRAGGPMALAAHFVMPGALEPPSSLCERGLDFCQATRLLVSGTHALNIPYAFITDLQRSYLYDAHGDELLLHADSPAEFNRHFPEIISRADVERGALGSLRRQPRSYVARQLREWCCHWCAQICEAAPQLSEQQAACALDRILVLRFLFYHDILKRTGWDFRKRFGGLVVRAVGGNAKGCGRELVRLFRDLYREWDAGLFVSEPIVDEALVRDEVTVPLLRECALLSRTKFTIPTILESFNFGEPDEKARVRTVPEGDEDRLTYLSRQTTKTVDSVRLDVDIQEEGYRAVAYWFDEVASLYQRLAIEYEAQEWVQAAPHEDDADLLAWAERKAAQPQAITDPYYYAAEHGLLMYCGSQRQFRTARLMLYLHLISLYHRSGEHFDRFPKLCLLYTSPSPRDRTRSRMPSSA